MRAARFFAIGLAGLLLGQSIAEAGTLRRWRVYYYRTMLFGNPSYEYPEQLPALSLPQNARAVEQDVYPAAVPERAAALAQVSQPPAEMAAPLGWNFGTFTQVSTPPLPMIEAVPAPALAAPAPAAVRPSDPPRPALTARELDPAPAYNPLTKWASAVQVASASTYTPPTYDYDAFINLSDGNYAGSDHLTRGGARAWYESETVKKLYGGTPDAAQRADFSSNVLGRVEETFRRSGVPVSLTGDPGANAAHTLSVVSNTSFSGNPGAAGISAMGGDGFSFIDNLGYAGSVDELQWAVARNVAHELMHAFNVEHHDGSGDFLDSPVTSWGVLIDPGTIFSPEAVNDLLSQDFRSRYDSGMGVYGAQMLHSASCTCAQHQLSPVPEPATIMAWGSVLAGLGLYRLRRRRA